MGVTKTQPDYRTSHRGRHWTRALTAARKAGAVIVADDTGEPVTYTPGRSGAARFRPWIPLDGKRRYDSRDCRAEW